MWQRYRNSLQPAADLRDVLIPPANRIAVLDGARALGILLVIGLHCVFGASRLLGHEARTAFIAGFPRALDIFWQARGSDIIFILCGILVSRMLLREYARDKGIDVRAFYRRRLMRIVPMYWLALGVYLLADLDHTRNLWSNLLFISNLVPGEHNIVPVGWSMNTQVHFYLLLPWLLLALLRIRFPLLALCALLLAAAGILHAVVLQHPTLQYTPFHTLFDDRRYSELYGDSLYYNLHTRITPFLLGVMIAWVYHFRPARIMAVLGHPWGNTLLLVAGLGAMAAAVHIGIHNPADAFYQPFDAQRNLWYLVFNKTEFCTGAALLILCALFPAGLSRAASALLGLRVWHPISELVYGLYLYHFLCIAIAGALVLGTVHRQDIHAISNTQVFAIFGVALVLSLLLAALIHVLVEKPFIRMSRPAD